MHEDGGSGTLINDLALDATYVYWVEYFHGSVRRARKDGAEVTTLADEVGAPERVLVDERYVYWINTTGGVRLVNKTGGSVEYVTPDLPCGFTGCGRGLAIDDTTIYWVEDERMMSRLKDGGLPVQIDAPALDTEGGVLVDAQSIYWMSFMREASPGSTVDKYAVQATPKGGGIAETLAVFAEPWIGTAIDDANLYVAVSGGVWRVPKNGTAPVKLSDGPQQPLSITTDGDRVFVVERERVLSVSVDGGELVPIACDPAGYAVRVVVDETTVYWNDTRADTIMAQPK